MTQTPNDVRSRAWHRAIGQAWRKQVRPWWAQYKWVVLGGLGAAALGLGYVGFENDAREAGESRTFWDNFYLALRLFILECDAFARPIRWELQVARLLAPAVTLYTAAEAMAAICHEQLQGCTFKPGKGGHLKVYRGEKRSVLPMHGTKELGKGLVHSIKKDLGLQHEE